MNILKYLIKSSIDVKITAILQLHFIAINITMTAREIYVIFFFLLTEFL